MSRTEIAPYIPHDTGPARLHMPSVLGASPGKPMLYALPATGRRPLRFDAEGLPDGIALDREKGFLTGIPAAGEYSARISVSNSEGSDCRSLRILIREDGSGLTPMLGWCSWNAFGKTVSQQKIEQTADLMVSTGLSSYGYQFVNTDSAWQGEYGGKYDAIMSNEKFPDMKAMTDHIHRLGLKAGIYSTPMQKAWGGGEFPGCTRGKTDPKWMDTYYGIGLDHREQACVNQWTEWGFDYLKYDWDPCDPENAERMKDCLRRSERDFQFCVTVSAKLQYADYWKKNCNHWRDNSDSDDNWKNIVYNRFCSDYWAEHVSPGHFFDLDMLECGWICNHMTGQQRASRLTEDEKITAFTIRAVFPSPIQLSCDLSRLTAFDLALLCNEEVLRVNQDALGLGAVCIWEERRRDADRRETSHKRIYLKPLEDGGEAVAMFNLGEDEETLSLPLKEAKHIRDLWAKKDLGVFADECSLRIPPHGARLLKMQTSTL